MNIINAFLETITQTDEWNQLQEAPAIVQAEQSFREILEGLPSEQRDEIEAAAYLYTLACERAALLFGIGLVDKIHAAGADPVAHLQTLGY